MHRHIVRVRVNNDAIMDGVIFGPKYKVVRILPSIDKWEFGWESWVFFESPEFPPVIPGQEVPEFTAIFHRQLDKSIVVEVRPLEEAQHPS